LTVSLSFIAGSVPTLQNKNTAHHKNTAHQSIT
jgi:hypothetical protein